LGLNNNADCLAGALPHQMPSGFYDSKPYIAYNDAAISLKTRRLKIHNQTDLLPHRVNAFQSARTTLGDEWASLYKYVVKYAEYNNQSYQIHQVLKGIHDVMILDVHVAEHLYASMAPSQKFADIFTVHEIFSKTYYSLACRKEADVLSFNQGVEKLRASGAYQKIYESFSVAL
jgi:polar amino acid transport system substrate-binding protein